MRGKRRHQSISRPGDCCLSNLSTCTCNRKVSWPSYQQAQGVVSAGANEDMNACEQAL
jgi:hypothetical protein